MQPTSEGTGVIAGQLPMRAVLEVAGVENVFQPMLDNVVRATFNGLKCLLLKSCGKTQQNPVEEILG